MSLHCLFLVSLVFITGTNARLSTQPCEIVETAGKFAFHCSVESTQFDGKKVATFSRPFDLMTSSGIQLPDERIDPETQKPFPFSYFFNPLGSLASSSSILKDKGCESTGPDLKNKWDAGAYQWDSRLKEKGCTRLTGQAAGGNTKYAYNGWQAFLLDVEDASRGIMLHMTGGDACGVAGPRKFNVSLMCDTSPVAQKRKFNEESVTEDQTCTYEIDLSTTHGCPDECSAPFDVFENGKEPGGTADATKDVCNSKGSCRSRADGTPECACTAGDAFRNESSYVGPGCSFACPNEFSKSCSNVGHCKYEPGFSDKVGKAKCFCDLGYIGDQCETKDTTSGSSSSVEPTSSAVPWILLLLLSAVFAGAWWYHRKQHEEPFCCCGNGNGYGEGFSGEGPPRFSSGLESGGYVAPSSEQSI